MYIKVSKCIFSISADLQLTSKGSDYDGLLDKHRLNQECLNKIKKAIRWVYLFKR